jgi:hypothetical protein
MSRSVCERFIFLSSSGIARGCHEVPRWGTGTPPFSATAFMQSLPECLREPVAIPVFRISFSLFRVAECPEGVRVLVGGIGVLTFGRGQEWPRFPRTVF